MGMGEDATTKEVVEKEKERTNKNMCMERKQR
jgi:hypothetical protein